MKKDDTATRSEATAPTITSEEAERIVDQLAAEPLSKRVWEVDFLRGLMILFVSLDHFLYDVTSFAPYKTGFFRWLYTFASNYDGNATVIGRLENVTHNAFVMLFVLLSGVSCVFSRNNFKRALKMAIFALALSAVTYAVSAIVHYKVTISFNVIHVLALCQLLYALAEYLRGKLKKKWQINLYGWLYAAVLLASFVVGYYFRANAAENAGIFVFLFANKGSYAFSPGDFLPFLPAFGYFLLGAFLGTRLYRDKTTLFPTVNEKHVAFLTFCGRRSLYIYFGFQVVAYGFFALFATVLGVL